MLTDETPTSYGTQFDPRPTLAQVLAAFDAAVAYWTEEQDEALPLAA